MDIIGSLLTNGRNTTNGAMALWSSLNHKSPVGELRLCMRVKVFNSFILDPKPSTIGCLRIDLGCCGNLKVTVGEEVVILIESV